jgi:DNA-binding NarL/FixJ family response regulator
MIFLLSMTGIIAINHFSNLIYFSMIGNRAEIARKIYGLSGYHQTIEPMSVITVQIIDDHRLITDALAAILNSEPQRFKVIATSTDPLKAIEQTHELKPAIVLTDINISPIDGFEITRRICQLKTAKVIGISMYSQVAYVKKLFLAGAMGYVTKNSPKEEMIHAIQEVFNGTKYLCQEVRDLLAEESVSNISAPVQLTGKELELLPWIKKGLTSKEIAEEHRLSYKTVEVHRYNILKKLGIRNTAALINYINREGL